MCRTRWRSMPVSMVPVLMRPARSTTFCSFILTRPEEVIVPEQQKDEKKKLGAVTYVDPDKTEAPIHIAGVTFLPGEAVNLDELLPEEHATRLKEKLANNPYF